MKKQLESELKAAQVSRVEAKDTIEKADTVIVCKIVKVHTTFWNDRSITSHFK